MICGKASGSWVEAQPPSSAPRRAPELTDPAMALTLCTGSVLNAQHSTASCGHAPFATWHADTVARSHAAAGVGAMRERRLPLPTSNAAVLYIAIFGMHEEAKHRCLGASADGAITHQGEFVVGEPDEPGVVEPGATPPPGVLRALASLWVPQRGDPAISLERAELGRPRALDSLCHPQRGDSSNHLGGCMSHRCDLGGGSGGSVLSGRASLYSNAGLPAARPCVCMSLKRGGRRLIATFGRARYAIFAAPDARCSVACVVCDDLTSLQAPS